MSTTVTKITAGKSRPCCKFAKCEGRAGQQRRGPRWAKASQRARPKWVRSCTERTNPAYRANQGYVCDLISASPCPNPSACETSPSPRTFVKNFDYPTQADPATAKTLLTGVRAITGRPNDVFVCGFYTDSKTPATSFVFEGKLGGPGEGTWYDLNHPDGTNTNLYGPTNLEGQAGSISVVGNTTLSGNEVGIMYRGRLNNSGTWTVIEPTPLLGPGETLGGVIMHSNFKDVAVGNFTIQGQLPPRGHAFLYDIENKTYQNIEYTGGDTPVLSQTAYGIYGACEDTNLYTIAGGLKTAGVPGSGEVERAYLVDYNRETKTLSNWRVYSFGNDPSTATVTHFDGITTNFCGGFSLTGDTVVNGTLHAFGANVDHEDVATWEFLEVTGGTGASGNTVVANDMIGVYNESGVTHGFIGRQALKCCPAGFVQPGTKVVGTTCRYKAT